MTAIFRVRAAPRSPKFFFFVKGRSPLPLITGQTIVVFTVIREFCGQRLATIITIIIRTYLYTSTHQQDCVRLRRGNIRESSRLRPRHFTQPRRRCPKVARYDDTRYKVCSVLLLSVSMFYV